MPKKVLTPTKSDAEAAKSVTGCAIVVPRGGPTDGKHQQKGCVSALAVHAAVVAKPAYATPFRPCSLRLLLNGTIAATLAHLLTTQPALLAKCGGTVVSEAAFKPESVVAPMCENHFLAPRSPHSAGAM